MKFWDVSRGYLRASGKIASGRESEIAPGDSVTYFVCGDCISDSVRLPEKGGVFRTEKELPTGPEWPWERVSHESFGGDLGFGVHGCMHRYTYRMKS